MNKYKQMTVAQLKAELSKWPDDLLIDLELFSEESADGETPDRLAKGELMNEPEEPGPCFGVSVVYLRDQETLEDKPARVTLRGLLTAAAV